MMNPTQTKVTDEFTSPEYAPDVQALPWMQILNDKDPIRSGFFISAEHVDAIHLKVPQEWQPHEATFNSGESTVGFRSLSARFLILRRSPLLMFSRSEGSFLGPFNRSAYNADVVLKTRYLVFLVDGENQLLHDTPLQFTAKGSVCGSFGEHYKLFRQQMNQAFGPQRGDRFFALAVFAVKLQPELKGGDKKSWVCSVIEHGVPTAANWRTYFVGYDAATKEKVLADFETYADFGKLAQEKSIDSLEPLAEDEPF